MISTLPLCFAQIGKLISDAMAKVGRQGVVTMEESRTAEDNLYVVEGMQFDRGYISPYFVTDPERMVAEYDNCRLLLVDKKISTARYIMGGVVCKDTPYVWCCFVSLSKSFICGALCGGVLIPCSPHSPPLSHTHSDIIGILEAAIRGGFPLMVMAEDIEQEALATLVVNKLRGNLKVVAVKAPGFGERKSSYLEDIAILTGATVVKDELGMSLDKVWKRVGENGCILQKCSQAHHTAHIFKNHPLLQYNPPKATEEVLGKAAKITVNKEATTIVGDGSTQDAVNARVKQIRTLLENTDAEYEKEKLNERIARLSGGVAIIQVGAQTETELKEKKLRVEDALNATKAAVEEGIVVGGGCALLRLSAKVDEVRETLSNDEQKMGADIVKRALSYPMRLIASNAGVNGSIVVQKVLDNGDVGFGYNAATDTYQDLLKAGIIDPTKVVRCAIENAASVSKTFLTSDVVITEIPEPEAAMPAGGPDMMGGY